MAGAGSDGAVHSMDGSNPRNSSLVDTIIDDREDMSQHRQQVARMLAETEEMRPPFMVKASHKIPALSSTTTSSFYAQDQNSPFTMSIARNQGRIARKEQLRRIKTYRNARPSPIRTIGIDIESTSSDGSPTFQPPESPTNAACQNAHFFPSPRSVLDRRSSSDSFY